MLFTKTNLEALFNLELIFIHKNILRGIIEVRIKPYIQKKNYKHYWTSNYAWLRKTNLEALLNFELNVIHKNKVEIIIELRIKSYSQKQTWKHYWTSNYSLLTKTNLEALFTKTKSEALLNFEINLDHKKLT